MRESRECHPQREPRIGLQHEFGMCSNKFKQASRWRHGRAVAEQRVLCGEQRKGQPTTVCTCPLNDLRLQVAQMSVTLSDCGESADSLLNG